MKRTNLQNSYIHSLKHKTGISEENYRAAILVVSENRTDTSAELTHKEANELIVKLGGTLPDYRSRQRNATSKVKGKSTRTMQRQRKAAGVETLPSGKQLKYLHALGAERWHDGYDAPLAALARKTIKRDRPTTSKEASKLIQAITELNKREGK